MRPLDPILVVHLFPEERAALLDLLSSLTPADWERPTVCPGWSIKDIAAHLLGDDLGRLSWGRDSFHGGFFEPAAGSTDPEAVQAELTAFINRQNEDWVAAARPILPSMVSNGLLGIWFIACSATGFAGGSASRPTSPPAPKSAWTARPPGGSSARASRATRQLPAPRWTATSR